MSQPKPLTDSEIAALLDQYPQLPQAYLQYLRDIGSGEAPSGKVIYKQPMHPSYVYGARCATSNMWLLGDDTQGYCFGFDPTTGQVGEFSPRGAWEPWSSGEGFLDYVN